jgi:hypothetical protein
VESVSAEEEGGSQRRRVRLQITDLEMTTERSNADRAQSLFGGGG